MTSSTSHSHTHTSERGRETETPTGRAGSPGPASLDAALPNLNRLPFAETPLPLPSTSTARHILPASASVSSFAVCASRSSPGRSDRAGLGAGHDGDLVYVLVSGQQVGGLRALSVRVVQGAFHSQHDVTHGAYGVSWGRACCFTVVLYRRDLYIFIQIQIASPLS